MAGWHHSHDGPDKGQRDTNNVKPDIPRLYLLLVGVHESLVLHVKQCVVPHVLQGYRRGNEQVVHQQGGRRFHLPVTQVMESSLLSSEECKCHWGFTMHNHVGWHLAPDTRTFNLSPKDPT
jgi:hypothetical protein